MKQATSQQHNLNQRTSYQSIIGGWCCVSGLLLYCFTANSQETLQFLGFHLWIWLEYHPNQETSRIMCEQTKAKHIPSLPNYTAILGMVIPPLIGNPYNGYINPYYWVDDHPLLYGNNESLDPGTCVASNFGFPLQKWESQLQISTEKFSHILYFMGIHGRPP